MVIYKEWRILYAGRGGDSMTIYERNYKKIKPLLADYRKIEVDGFMPLVVEKISDNEYSIAHYYECNGDLIRDPEITVRVYHDMGMVEVLSYTQDNLGIYKEVYPALNKVRPRLKKELNQFLSTWLDNLKLQGFYDKL